MTELLLTEDQQLLKDSAQRYVLDRYDFETYQAIVASPEGFSSEQWQAFADMGWLALSVPEEHAGLDGSMADLLVLCEALGRGLVVDPFLSTAVLCSYGLRWSGTGERRGELLARLATGQWRGAWAGYERRGRHNPTWIETVATRTSTGHTISGSKHAVLHAPMADDLIIAARTAGRQDDRTGITLFVVPSTAEGVVHTTYETIHGWRASNLTLEDVEVSADALLGEENNAADVLLQVANVGAAAMCADALGCMQQLNAATQEYLRSREQFGQPLGKFQALQHRIADMYIAEKRCESLVGQLRAALGSEEGLDSQAVSACKAQVGISGRFIGQQAIQLHGGIGITDELNVGHYFKRLTAIDALFGDVDYHLDRFAADSLEVS